MFSEGKTQKLYSTHQLPPETNVVHIDIFQAVCQINAIFVVIQYYFLKKGFLLITFERNSACGTIRNYSDYAHA